jgi:hypothetical protein
MHNDPTNRPPTDTRQLERCLTMSVTHTIVRELGEVGQIVNPYSPFKEDGRLVLAALDTLFLQRGEVYVGLVADHSSSRGKPASSCISSRKVSESSRIAAGSKSKRASSYLSSRCSSATASLHLRVLEPRPRGDWRCLFPSGNSHNRTTRPTDVLLK